MVGRQRVWGRCGGAGQRRPRHGRLQALHTVVGLMRLERWYTCGLVRNKLKTKKQFWSMGATMEDVDAAQPYLDLQPPHRAGAWPPRAGELARAL